MESKRGQQQQQQQPHRLSSDLQGLNLDDLLLPPATGMANTPVASPSPIRPTGTIPKAPASAKSEGASVSSSSRSESRRKKRGGDRRRQQRVVAELDNVGAGGASPTAATVLDDVANPLDAMPVVDRALGGVGAHERTELDRHFRETLKRREEEDATGVIAEAKEDGVKGGHVESTPATPQSSVRKSGSSRRRRRKRKKQPEKPSEEKGEREENGPKSEEEEDDGSDVEGGSSGFSRKYVWRNVVKSGAVKKCVLVEGGEGAAQPPPRPTAGDMVLVRSQGKLRDGRIVDDHATLVFTVGEHEVIEGLDVAVRSMAKNELAIVSVKPEAAYGKVGRKGDIPPDARITYLFGLMHFEKQKEVSGSHSSLYTERVFDYNTSIPSTSQPITSLEVAKGSLLPTANGEGEAVSVQILNREQLCELHVNQP
jgi:FKBP-type peptidyl-prolyl cis-trans isomerase